MKNYEIRIYLKKHNITRIITAIEIYIGNDIIKIVDYATGEPLVYNRNDVKIEYIKEAK